MSFLKVKNRAYSTLASGVDNDDTEWTVATGEGANFPSSGDFHITCEDEIVKCTSRTGDVLTVTRGAESTTPASHASGKAVELRVTAGVIEDIQNSVLRKDGSIALTGNLDFAKYKAIAMVCDNGATMPTSPTNWQWFLHTPTGRNILYQYNSKWIPIISVGSMTVYVDKTDGTDDLNHGTGVDSDAFATVQYAIDCIPGLVGGNVIININGEDYDETVTIQGKQFSGNYTITLQGTLSQQDTATIESAVQGTGATQGSITDTGKFGSYDNMLMYANSEYRLIDSDTADVATIVGCWSATPSGTWVVYDWATSINKLVIVTGQKGIVGNDIELDTSDALTLYPFSECTLNRCKLAACYLHIYTASCLLYDVLIIGDPGASRALWIQDSGLVNAYRTKLSISRANAKCVSAYNNAVANILNGSIIDGNSSSGIYGMHTELNAVAVTYAAAADGYVRIRNCNVGIRAEDGAQVAYTSNNQYSGNSTDESEDAATFGAID